MDDNNETDNSTWEVNSGAKYRVHFIRLLNGVIALTESFYMISDEKYQAWVLKDSSLVLTAAPLIEYGKNFVFWATVKEKDVQSFKKNVEAFVAKTSHTQKIDEIATLTEKAFREAGGRDRPL